MNYWKHKSAEVSSEAKIGSGTKIWHHSQIQSGAEVGQNCVIGHNCLVCSQAKLGQGVKLESNIDIWGLITLEDDVFVGPSAVFTNDKNPRAAYPKNGDWIPTLIRKGATIGANATIICGITIDQYAFIGAGAVVTKNIPEYAVVAGVPAKIIGWICQCGKKLKFANNKATCQCSLTYTKKQDIVKIT